AELAAGAPTRASWTLRSGPAAHKGRGRSFFSSFGPRPDLHSFPTRRSSDLSEHAGGGLQRIGLVIGVPLVQQQLRKLPKSGVVRSEEHTSELQSRSDLVCRLLLEKKNQKKAANDPRTARRTSLPARHPPFHL